MTVTNEDDDLFNPFYLSQRDCELLYDPTDPDLEPGWYYWWPKGLRVGPIASKAEAEAQAADDERRYEKLGPDMEGTIYP